NSLAHWQNAGTTERGGHTCISRSVPARLRRRCSEAARLTSPLRTLIALGERQQEAEQNWGREGTRWRGIELGGWRERGNPSRPPNTQVPPRQKLRVLGCAELFQIAEHQPFVRTPAFTGFG